MEQHRVNYQIRVPEVLVIDEEGVQLGAMPTKEAQALATSRSLDLVMVADKADPPVCRLMDYGKLQYQQNKKKRETGKVSPQLLKELSVSLKISDNDLLTKVKQAYKFLIKGNKVKFNLILRGREKGFTKTLGTRQLDRIANVFSDEVVIERKSDQLIGNRIFVIVAPSKSKKIDLPDAKEILKKIKAGDINAQDEDTQGHREASESHKDRESNA